MMTQKGVQYTEMFSSISRVNMATFKKCVTDGRSRDAETSRTISFGIGPMLDQITVPTAKEYTVSSSSGYTTYVL